MIPEGIRPEGIRPQHSGQEHHQPPRPQPEPRRRRTSSGCLIVAVLGLLMAFALAAMLFIGSMLSGGFDFEAVGSGDAVAVVRVQGILTDAEATVDEIERFSKMSSVKAMVIRINSPGGFVAPSQEIYSALLRARKKEKIPVIVSMGTVAASGGYYVALGADKILANPGSATGSIGVILSYPVFGDLFDKIGVSMERVKSGEFKDIGDPTRPLTEKERLRKR